MVGPFWSFVRRNSIMVRPGLLSQAVVYGSNVIGLSYFLKNTVFLKYTKGFSEKYGNYGPDEPAEELNVILNDIMSKDLKDLASENTPIALFLTPDMETTHLGAIGTVNGGFVGVPAFFEFKKEQDALDNIMVKKTSYDATKDQEQEICDCFLISDKAKKYGIAREVLLINTLQLYINAILPFAVSIVVVFLYNGLQESYHVLRYPLYTRGMIYTAVTIIGLSFWRLLYKNVRHYYESEVEANIVQLGTDYVEGGVEYCTKQLKRNSLPIEIKNERIRIFKAIDDLISSLLPSGIPVKVRLGYLQAHLDEMSNKNIKQ